MQELTLHELQQVSLNLLLDVHQFCDAHKIKYSIAYGTLIGALRHKGFIPWDDDIDIIMMRDEYERFIKIYQDDYYKLIPGKDLANHYHVVISDNSTQLVFNKNTANDYFYKGGLWVDVFPIDSVPDKTSEYRSLMRKIHLMAGLEQASQYKKNIYRTLPYYLLKPFSGLFGKKALDLILSYNNKSTSNVANLSLYYLNYPSFPAKYMDVFVDVEFEGVKFKAMKHYDEFLKGIYGDYMQLPPLEERIPRHAYSVYKRE